MKRFKVDIPWLLIVAGVRKWMAERMIHVPDDALASCAAAAGVTPEQWRAVEQTQAALLYNGIVLKTQ